MSSTGHIRAVKDKNDPRRLLLENDPEDVVIGRRLREAVEGKMQFKDAAAVAGVSPKTFTRWLQGQQAADAKGLQRLTSHLSLPIETILAPNAPQVGSVMEGARRAMQQIEQDRALKDRVLVPYYPEVEASAGPGAIATDHVQEVTLAFRQDWVRKRGLSSRGLQAIHVRGDSMEPTLRSGDLIVFDTESTRHSDGLFVLNFDGELLVKRLQRLSQTRLVIASDNPLAGSSEIDLRDETQHPRIIGRVVWLGRDL